VGNFLINMAPDIEDSEKGDHLYTRVTLCLFAEFPVQSTELVMFVSGNLHHRLANKGHGYEYTKFPQYLSLNAVT